MKYLCLIQLCNVADFHYPLYSFSYIRMFSSLFAASHGDHIVLSCLSKELSCTNGRRIEDRLFEKGNEEVKRELFSLLGNLQSHRFIVGGVLSLECDWLH